jgi:hypothetical protein
MGPDVVYIVRYGERNDELRYSLRSLANLPHGRVWVAGYAPTWTADTVGVIPVRRDWDKYRSARANLRAVCHEGGVSSPFVLMNDDFFVMRPIDAPPVLHHGRLDRHIVDRGAIAPSSHYTRGMVATREFLEGLGLPGPLRSYALHVPMLMRRPELLEVLDMRPARVNTYHVRTVYGNVHDVGGRFARDPKVHERTRGEAWRRWALLSTNDETFATHPAGAHIRRAFPSPSRYERA